MTVTVLHLSFKVCLQCRQLGPQVFLQGSGEVQRQNQSVVADSILRLGAYRPICCLICRKIIKIGQQLPKLQQMLGLQGTLF